MTSALLVLRGCGPSPGWPALLRARSARATGAARRGPGTSSCPGRSAWPPGSTRTRWPSTPSARSASASSRSGPSPRGPARQPAAAVPRCPPTARWSTAWASTTAARRRPPRAGRRRRRTARRVVVGVNIGRTKAVADGRRAARLRRRRAPRGAARRLRRRQRQLAEHAGPARPPGGRRAAAAARGGARGARRGRRDRRVPLLVKIAPDLADDDVDAVADLALALGLDGIVADEHDDRARRACDAAGRGRGGGRRRAVGRAARAARRWPCCGGCARAPATGSSSSRPAASRRRSDAWARLRAGRHVRAGLHGLRPRRSALAVGDARGARALARRDGFANSRTAIGTDA